MIKPILTIEELLVLSDKVKAGEELTEDELEKLRNTFEYIAELLAPLVKAFRDAALEFFRKLEAILDENKTNLAKTHKTLLSGHPVTLEATQSLLSSPAPFTDAAIMNRAAQKMQ